MLHLYVEVADCSKKLHIPPNIYLNGAWQDEQALKQFLVYLIGPFYAGLNITTAPFTPTLSEAVFNSKTA